MKVVEEVMTRNCLRKDSELILGNLLLVTELLITVFIVKLLIFLKSISRLHWNWELYSLEVVVMIMGIIRRKPVLTMRALSEALLESVNSVNVVLL